MPQTGSDLVGAGYPIGNAITALLGGTFNGVQPNLPVVSNLYFGMGNLQDVAGAGSATTASVVSVAVPVTPGATISKVSWVAGATAAACVTNLWSAIYTGTGSAPGTAGAQPVLISSSTSASTTVAASSLVTFTLSSPQTITSVQAPYGYIYASYYIATGAGSPNGIGNSLISATAAAAAQYPWFATSPYGLAFTSNSGAGSTVPGNLGTASRAANPPVVLLS
jgi:hypothetical protein